MERLFLFIVGSSSLLLSIFFGIETFFDMRRASSGYMNVFLFMTFSITTLLSISADALICTLSEVKNIRKTLAAKADQQQGQINLSPPSNSQGSVRRGLSALP